jgi:hypothetical protein
LGEPINRGDGGDGARHPPEGGATAPQDALDAAFLAGAGLAALDPFAREDQAWSGAWRRRLALNAAAACVTAAGRGEDKAALRDAFYLRRPCDDPGPAGQILIFWRRLVEHPPLENLDAIIAAADALGLRPDDALLEMITAAKTLGADAKRPAVFAAAETAAACLRLRPDAEALAFWLADAVLAKRLGWPLPVPLLAAEIFDPAIRRGPRRKKPRLDEAAWGEACCLAYARAAARACDLFGELGRRATRLEAAQPKLRAKGSKIVVAALLSDDAIQASARLGGMSDRAMRRLLDRLVMLGAARELTGRPTFRLYGL